MPLNDFVFWIDANLPFKAVYWLQDNFGVHAEHLQHILLTHFETAVEKLQNPDHYFIEIR